MQKTRRYTYSVDKYMPAFCGLEICLSIQIKEKLDSLLAKQKDLVEKWEKHQEKLQRSE